VYENPLAFWRQSKRWQEWPGEETLTMKAQRTPRKKEKVS
jgi:hypothetical protein